MKIKNKLIISFFCFLAVFSVMVVFLVFSSMNDLADDNISTMKKTVELLSANNLNSALKGLDGIVEQNRSLSEKILTDKGERIVELIADSAANRLSYLFSRMPEPYDYTKIRNSKKLRKNSTRSIYAFENKKVGYIDLLDRKGEAVLHPNSDVEGENYRKWKKKCPEMWNLVKKSFTEDKVKGYYTFFAENTKEPIEKFMVLKHVPRTEFNVVAVVNINDFFIPVHKKIFDTGEKLKENTAQTIKKENMEISSQLEKYFENRTYGAMKNIALKASVILFLVVSAGLFMAFNFSSSLSKPIINLCKAVEKLGKGNFNVKVEENGSEEVCRLSEKFNQLGSEIKKYMNNLEEETAERQAVESEIQIARRVQSSLIPDNFSDFAEEKNIEIYAELLPAKHVAGDFYDFFPIDEKRIAFAVCDVSGKGVPAALFMAVCRTLIRTVAPISSSPADTLNRVNSLICSENDECMFVTVFLCFYNTENGELTFANAGHHNAYCLSSDLNLESFGSENEPALGIIDGQVYSFGRKFLKNNDTVILYTDGISEALSPNKEMFTDQRLEKLLSVHNCVNVKEICRNTVESVTDFESGCRFDDITILAFKRKMDA